MQEATFSLGERAAVLDQLDKPAIIPHMAEFEGRKFPYEVRAALAAAWGLRGWGGEGRRGDERG